MFHEIKVTNPLEFQGYEEKLKKAEQKSDLDEGVLCGVGNINSKNCLNSSLC